MSVSRAATGGAIRTALWPPHLLSIRALGNFGITFPAIVPTTTAIPGYISQSNVNEEYNEFDSLLASLHHNGDVNLGSIHSSGWLFGAFFGAQKQWGNWVLGLEADVDGTDIKGSTSASTSYFSGYDGEGRYLDLQHTVSLESKIDELSSVRGKVGYAWSPNWMLYGTGGMAFAHVKNTLTNSESLYYSDGTCPEEDYGECGSFYAANQYIASANQTMLGYTLGVGLDYKVQIDPGSAWVFGVQYQYYNFPTQTFTFSGPAGGSLALSTSETINVVKGRISYLFSIH